MHTVIINQAFRTRYKDGACCETLRLNHPGVEIFRKSMTDGDLHDFEDEADVLLLAVYRPSDATSRRRVVDAHPRAL